MAGGARQVRRRPRADPVRLSSPGIEHAPRGGSEYANTVNGGPSPSSALPTDLNLSAEILWRIYRGRADCESRIKELKYDFATDSFNKTTAESLKIVRRKIYRLCARKYDAATTFAYAIALDCPSHRRPMPQARYKSPPAPPARQKYRPAQNQASPR